MNQSVRLGVIGVVFLSALALLTLRLWTMQVTEVHAYEDKALANQSRIVFTPAPRGDVYDRNGVKLAGTRSALAVVVDLALVTSSDRDLLAQNLSAFLDTPAASVKESFESDSQGGLVTIAKDLTDAQATFILEHREQFPGVNIIPQPIRTYPLGEIGSHVIGYIGRPNEEDLQREDVKGTDVVGKAGVERSYDAMLRGTEGVIEYQVDAKRKVLSLASEEAPSAGGSLTLTIDSELQAQLQASLKDGLVQARREEMAEREAAIADKSIAARLAEALAAAQAERRAQDAAATSDSTDQTTAQAGTEDDDVALPDEPVTVDPAEVLASLYPGLPIDSDGVCVPVQRIDIPVGQTGLLSGREPRFARVDSVADDGGELVATISIGLDRYTVGVNDSFAGTVQVLALSESRVALYHRDAWCPIRSVGVVTDPNDGSVLAMASYPAFDPAVFVDGLSDDQWAELGTASAFQNFAIQGVYAPASTFKAVPYVLALEENYYPLDRNLGDKEITDGADGEPNSPPPLLRDTDEYLCSGEFKFPLSDGSIQTKRDWRWPRGHGPLDLHGALQASCDLYFWDLALRLWQERRDESGIDKENLLQEYARSFGFGEVTGIDLPFERSGLMPDAAWFREEQRNKTGRVRPEGPWVGGDLMDIAVGQGATLVTPLQLANGFAAMVNGGTVWTPRVVQEVRDADGNVIATFDPIVDHTVQMRPSTSEKLLVDLQQVVNNEERGTARVAFRDFGRGRELVGGKTGTGEVIKAPRSDAYRQADNAWFVGVAPISNPQWIVTVVVERGGSGGKIAAPIARQILQYLMNGPEGVTELAPGLDAD